MFSIDRQGVSNALLRGEPLNPGLRTLASSKRHIILRCMVQSIFRYYETFRFDSRALAPTFDNFYMDAQLQLPFSSALFLLPSLLLSSFPFLFYSDLFSRPRLRGMETAALKLCSGPGRPATFDAFWAEKKCFWFQQLHHCIKPQRFDGENKLAKTEADFYWFLATHIISSWDGCSNPKAPTKRRLCSRVRLTDRHCLSKRRV